MENGYTSFVELADDRLGGNKALNWARRHENLSLPETSSEEIDRLHTRIYRIASVRCNIHLGTDTTGGNTGGLREIVFGCGYLGRKLGGTRAD
jgi:hypothetical protein